MIFLPSSSELWDPPSVFPTSSDVFIDSVCIEFSSLLLVFSESGKRASVDELISRLEIVLADSSTKGNYFRSRTLQIAKLK